MTEDNLNAFRALRDDIPEDRSLDDIEENNESNVLHIQDVLDGHTRINISHAGGEFVETLQHGLEEEVKEHKKSAPDYCDRRDRTENLVNGWDTQMDRMVHAYMVWCTKADLGSSREEAPRMVEEFSIMVVDLYESSKVDVELGANGAGVPAALIKQGLVPCSPWDPSVAIATRVLELYRTTHANNPCSDQWKNMINNVTSKMWGIFDETSIFLGLCQHGFVLVVADMIRSGELAKYPLAIVEVLLEAFGLKIGGGYGISCHFGKFLCDNYRPALRFFLQTEPGLKQWMVQEGIDDYDTFYVWLEEEKEYLLGLDNGLPKKREETLEMKRVDAIWKAAQAALADDADFNPASVSQVARRHATEQRNREAELVEHLELQLKVEVRWTSSSPEWIAAAAEIRNHKYQNALDKIEEIIVERLLEMTKIHQSGTGYKLRSHIAKALQARSKGIRNAIDRYNEVALAMAPLMPTLSWDEVVKYGFLAEFDILRDTRDSIRSRPWTCRNYRLAMDSYFKILRAREEIKCLNIEIQRVVTWINDEDLFLRKKEEQYKASNPHLAVQISRYQLRCARSDTIHMNWFWALAKTPGFTGSVIPGVSIELQKTRDGGREAMEVVSDVRTQWAPVDQEWLDEEDEGEVAESEMVAELMYQVSMLAVDRAEGGGIQLDLE
ncbi:hypothetical protein K438DRAFT_1987421 [Mycena galopus ATCC 62051]|nr:hypothetical protein K438DRAFT_1987421 [Mycena galopus ATCC 62051]